MCTLHDIVWVYTPSKFKIETVCFEGRSDNYCIWVLVGFRPYFVVSVFSNLAAEKQLPHHDGCNAGLKIGNITFSQADIEEAIDDMNRDASSTDHDIPAIILKECKNNIS